MNYTIYLLEDEEALNDVLRAYLTKEGWFVRSFLTIQEATQFLDTPPHLWILDITLPDGNGYDFLQTIQKHQPNVPIIFISARDQAVDRLIGLELGSDDYLAKPFLPKELVLRTTKLLQRTYQETSPTVDTTLPLGPYQLNVTQRTITKNNVLLDITSLELDLLFWLATRANEVVSREDILQGVWGETYVGSDRVVDDLIRRVRKKLPLLRIETVYGYGYRLIGLVKEVDLS